MRAEEKHDINRERDDKSGRREREVWVVVVVVKAVVLSCSRGRSGNSSETGHTLSTHSLPLSPH